MFQAAPLQEACLPTRFTNPEIEFSPELCWDLWKVPTTPTLTSGSVATGVAALPLALATMPPGQGTDRAKGP